MDIGRGIIEFTALEIATGALGPNVPSKPVRLSANHRVLLDGWKVELAVGEARVLRASQNA